jgi:hypothetical protein
LIFAKACGFQTNTLTLFFFLKEKEAKRIKKRAVLSPISSALCRKFFRLPVPHFCWRKNCPEPRRIKTIYKFFTPYKTVRHHN